MSDAAVHGCAYSDDPFYEQDYGLVGAPREAVVYDWQRRCYYKVVLQPMRTSKDVVTPSTAPLVVEDKLDLRPSPVRQRVMDYLDEYGPTTIKVLAAELDADYQAIFAHIRRDKGETYCVTGRSPELWRAKVYGLVGVHDAQE